MSKTKARERAKKKDALKAKKRKAAAAEDGQSSRPGHFDPGTASVKSPVAKGGGANVGAVRRGAARSR